MAKEDEPSWMASNAFAKSSRTAGAAPIPLLPSKMGSSTLSPLTDVALAGLLILITVPGAKHFTSLGGRNVDLALHRFNKAPFAQLYDGFATAVMAVLVFVPKSQSGMYAYLMTSLRCVIGL